MYDAVQGNATIVSLLSSASHLCHLVVGGRSSLDSCHLSAPSPLFKTAPHAKCRKTNQTNVLAQISTYRCKRVSPPYHRHSSNTVSFNSSILPPLTTTQPLSHPHHRKLLGVPNPNPLTLPVPAALPARLPLALSNSNFSNSFKLLTSLFASISSYSPKSLTSSSSFFRFPPKGGA
jgi:hypothetical protein